MFQSIPRLNPKGRIKSIPNLIFVNLSPEVTYGTNTVSSKVQLETEITQKYGRIRNYFQGIDY